MRKTISIWKVATTLAKEVSPNVNEARDYFFETHQESIDFYDYAVESEDFVNVYLPERVQVSTFKNGKLRQEK